MTVGKKDFNSILYLHLGLPSGLIPLAPPLPPYYFERISWSICVLHVWFIHSKPEEERGALRCLLCNFTCFREASGFVSDLVTVNQLQQL
jgi:hypothetical protein